MDKVKIKMTKSPFIVYFLPIILSVSLGTFVMAEALNDSERQLNMWQFDSISESSSNKLSIIGLEKNYSVSDNIQFKIKINDSNFECGDLYITIYDITNSEEDQIITQSGFLKQCFVKYGQSLPLGEDEYSEILTEPGEYSIVIEIFDEKYKNSLSYTEIINVNTKDI